MLSKFWRWKWFQFGSDVLVVLSLSLSLSHVSMYWQFFYCMGLFRGCRVESKLFELVAECRSLLSLVSTVRQFFYCMGLFRGCSVESKLFELVVEGRCQVYRIFERSRDSFPSLCLGNVNVSWLLATIKEVVLEEGRKEFWRCSRVGFPTLLAQWCSNKHERFLVVMEFGRGKGRGLF